MVCVRFKYLVSGWLTIFLCIGYPHQVSGASLGTANAASDSSRSSEEADTVRITIEQTTDDDTSNSNVTSTNDRDSAHQPIETPPILPTATSDSTDMPAYNVSHPVKSAEYSDRSPAVNYPASMEPLLSTRTTTTSTTTTSTTTASTSRTPSTTATIATITTSVASLATTSSGTTTVPLVGTSPLSRHELPTTSQEPQQPTTPVTELISSHEPPLLPKTTAYLPTQTTAPVMSTTEPVPESPETTRPAVPTSEEPITQNDTVSPDNATETPPVKEPPSTTDLPETSPEPEPDEPEPHPEELLPVDLGEPGKTTELPASSTTEKLSFEHEGPAMSHYDFTQPDGVAPHLVTDGTTFIEAFKDRSNDAIFASRDQNQFGRLSWVSVGHISPLKIRRTLANNSVVSDLFYFTDEGYHFYLGSLSNEHRELLANELARKHRVNVTRQQISQLRVDTVGCTLRYRVHGIWYTAEGDAHEINTIPWKVEFVAGPGDRAREALEYAVQQGRKLVLDCELTKYAKLSRRNRLRIMPEQIDMSQFVTEILGGSQEKLVTKYQFAQLGQDIARRLDIFREFDVPNAKHFEDNFVNPLIDQMAVSQFQFMPLERVLADLSSYKFDHKINGDLNANQIKKVLGKVFNLIKTEGREYIIADNSYQSTLLAKAKEPGGGAAKAVGMLAQLVNIEAVVKFVAAHEVEYENSSKSVYNQLEEINNLSGAGIMWDFEGSEIRPTAILVTKIAQSSFEKSLEFPRIYRKLSSFDFHRELRLYTNRAPEFETNLRDSVTKLHESFMAMSVQMATAEMALNSLKKYVEEDSRTKASLMSDVSYLKEQLQYLNASKQELSDEILFIKENFATNDALERLYRSLNRRVPN